MKENDIPTQIRDLLHNSGKSYYQIAKETGLTASTLQRIKEPDWGQQIKTAQKALQAVGCDLVIKKSK